MVLMEAERMKVSDIRYRAEVCNLRTLHNNPIYRLETLRIWRRMNIGKLRWLSVAHPAVWWESKPGGARLFYFITLMLCLAVLAPLPILLLTCLYSAYSAAAEREGHRLDQLILTGLQPHEIILGKCMAHCLPALRLVGWMVWCSWAPWLVIAFLKVLTEPPACQAFENFATLFALTCAAHALWVALLTGGSIIGTCLGFWLGGRSGGNVIAGAFTLAWLLLSLLVPAGAFIDSILGLEMLGWVVGATVTILVPLVISLALLLIWAAVSAYVAFTICCWRLRWGFR